MAEQRVHILLVDDDEDDYLLARDLLQDIGPDVFEIEWAQEFDDALSRLAGGRHDACLVDFRLGDRDGVELIREARRRGIEPPFILLTGQADHEVDLAAMNAGAADFLEKTNLSSDKLERSLRYAIHSHKVEAQRAQLLSVAEQQASQLRYLARELTQAEQRERRRVAQTLHDHLQQLLVAAKMRVERMNSLAGDDKLKRIVSQVEELLGASIEASRSLTVQLSPPVLHDRGLVAALEWLSRTFSKEHELDVEVIAVSDVDVADDHLKDFLFQAVRELLFNVVKHAESPSAQVIVSEPVAEHVQVRVRDEGRGCDVQSVVSRPSDGGFGLFHLQQRVEFLGGEFTVESEPGQGCDISILVPTQTPQQASRRPLPTGADRRVREPARPPQRTASPGAIRVLLADDHKILREGLAGLLRDQPGIEVIGEAPDGQAALELARELQPDVVVMDVTMPVMTGIEATRRIKRELPDVRVIGLSMHEEDDMAAAMLDAGASVYLPKGGPSESLVGAILQHAQSAPAAAR